MQITTKQCPRKQCPRKQWPRKRRPSFLFAVLATSGALSAVLVLSLMTTGCSIKESGNQARVSPFANREPFTASQAQKGKLRSLRKVVFTPIFISQDAARAEQLKPRFETKLEEIASGRLGIESILGRDVQREARKISGTRRFSHGERIELMKTFGGDAVLETVILKFQERKGSRLGAESPAEVGIHYRLFGQEREPIWEASYHFTDKALSEDIFSVKNRFSGSESQGQSRGLGKAGWKGASVLIEDSMEKALGDLEVQRARSFVLAR